MGKKPEELKINHINPNPEVVNAAIARAIAPRIIKEILARKAAEETNKAG